MVTLLGSHQDQHFVQTAVLPPRAQGWCPGHSAQASTSHRRCAVSSPQAHLQSTSEAHLPYFEPTSHLKGDTAVLHPKIQICDAQSPKRSLLTLLSDLTFCRPHPLAQDRCPPVQEQGDLTHSLTGRPPLLQRMVWLSS